MVIGHYRCPNSLSLLIIVVMDCSAVGREKGNSEKTLKLRNYTYNQ